MRIRKIIAVIMTAVVALSLVAYGFSDKIADDTNDKITDQAANVEGQRKTEEEVSFPLKESVKLSVFIQQGSDIVNLEDNVVFRELKKATNIEFELIKVPSEDAAEKLNLMLVSGEYPDIIMGSTLSNQDLEKYGVKEKILIPINDLIETYCPNIMKRWEEHPDWKEQMKSSDDKIYGIPSIDSAGVGHVNCAYKFWINQDWLNAVGLEMPVTTNDYKKALLAFKNQDPNGNGIADEIPLSGAIDSWNSDPYLYLMNAFGYFNQDYYYLKENKIISILDQDYIKEGLRYMNDLYTEGLIDQASFTQDYGQLNALGNNADIEILGSAGAGHVGLLFDINNVERYKKYAMMLPLEGPGGYSGLPYAKEITISSSNFAITDKCKYPEIAIQIADLFSSEEWAIRGQIGVQGKQWDYADEGTTGMDGVTPAKYKFLQYETPAQVSDAWWWTYRGMEPDWKVLIQTEGDIMDPANFESRLYVETLKLKPYAPNVDTMPSIIYSGDDSAAFTQLKTAVNDYAKIAIAEFITGKRKVDKDWDSYLAELDKLGYQKLIDLIQNTYDAR